MIRQVASLLLLPRTSAASSLSSLLPGALAAFGDAATTAPSAHAQCRTYAQETTSSSSTTTHQALVNKLLYRSRQRGFLELDLMVGLWAEKQLPTMSTSMLHHFSTVLDMENPDLFKWLTGQLPPPEDVLANPAFVALHRHVQQQLGQSSVPASQAPSGREWVRGWDDGWQKKSEAAPTP